MRGPINPSTNTRKIVKLRVNICRYGYGCVNVNVIVSESTYVHENVVGCVDVRMERKFSASIDKAKWICYNSFTK